MSDDKGRVSSASPKRSRRVSTPMSWFFSLTTGKPWWDAPASGPSSHARTWSRVSPARSVTTGATATDDTSTWPRKSAVYSLTIRAPRRAIFSVMIECFIDSIDAR